MQNSRTIITVTPDLTVPVHTARRSQHPTARSIGSPRLKRISRQGIPAPPGAA